MCYVTSNIFEETGIFISNQCLCGESEVGRRDGEASALQILWFLRASFKGAPPGLIRHCGGVIIGQKAPPVVKFVFFGNGIYSKKYKTLMESIQSKM